MCFYLCRRNKLLKVPKVTLKRLGIADIFLCINYSTGETVQKQLFSPFGGRNLAVMFNPIEPVHIVCQVLGGDTVKGFHPLFQLVVQTVDVVNMIYTFLVSSPLNLNQVSGNGFSKLLISIVAVSADRGLWLNFSFIQSCQCTCSQSAIAHGNQNQSTIPIHSGGNTDLLVADTTKIYFFTSLSGYTTDSWCFPVWISSYGCL